MEIPHTIKQEKADNFATEPVNFETNILDSMEIKLEPIKIEPHLYVSEPKNLDQKYNLTEETKMNWNNDKSMIIYSLDETVSNQKGLEIKLEGCIAIDKVKKMDDSVDVKWEMENDEINIKEEKNIENEEHSKDSTSRSQKIFSIPNLPSTSYKGLEANSTEEVITRVKDSDSETNSVNYEYSSEEEYFPTSDSSSTSGEKEVSEIKVTSKVTEPKSIYKLQKVTTTKEDDLVTASSDNCVTDPPKSRCVQITPAIKKDEDGKLVRNKIHACYFCQRTIQNLARHFTVLHGKEAEVAKILAMPKNSRQRRDGFTQLIRAGDFYHNTDVLSTKKGQLILVRRPTEDEVKFLTLKDYGPCPHCLGFMLKKHLWHHIQRSCSSKSNITFEKTRHVIAESEALLNDAFGSEFSRDFMLNICSKMREDDVGLYCKEDTLIQRFGAMLFVKYGTTQCELIRQSMRQLSRFTLKLQEVSNTKKKLSDYLVPEMFDLIIQATKELCVTHQNSIRRPEFEVSSLALKIGYALRRCAGIERGSCLRAGNLTGNEVLNSFLSLMDLEWKSKISSNALSTLNSRTLNSTQLLPLTSDLIKLSQYLNIEIKKEGDALLECPSDKKWCDLAILTLSKIVLFNKGRAGEAAKMTSSEYSSRHKRSEQYTDILKQSLSKFEKKLSTNLTLIEVSGKLGRKVPILLTPDTTLSIDRLRDTRDKVNVSKKNPFVFARSGNSVFSMRGHDCLRKVCLDAGLDHAAKISSKKLTSYAATVCQVINLSKDDYDWLSQYLGHDVRVHREYDRSRESAEELTKVSRLLIAVEKGEVNRLAGKELEEVKLEDLSGIEDSADDDVKEEITLSGMKTNIFQNEEYTSAIKKPKIAPALKISPFVQVAPREAVANSKFNDRRNWSAEEKKAVLNYFKSSIKRGLLPGKEDCTKCIEESNGILALRSWTHVKYCIKNHLYKLKKLKPKIS